MALSVAAPQPGLAAPATASQAGAVPEPDSYRTENYRAPVPATLAGATVIDTGEAHRLWQAGVPFVDTLPHAFRPANLPEGTVWRDTPHDTIRGAVWLANTGYGALDPDTESWFADMLARLSGGRTDRTMVLFCKAECWMSWNAARRAVSLGYSSIHWYPEGVDGWSAANYPMDRAMPLRGAP
ncbi:PQQ-dependent catabolism-associated CXXCW motif protein (plasmid) [Paroceanicella profunda]|uniref:PQQ-dependent catabolism-associated CXXCW motif protein n=2 Tax=Paroceanicella profunda TaxID=2579971 RepID=A0A5B8G4P2_9RHOB|nr:PQQ-dependent catabolism-associated CXXCW motif protein [Paroceanicella profunda]QDL94272.1 PQQ-dependent catabolism-associated CXXCW motif protein [Paroceanicella profunda]